MRRTQGRRGRNWRKCGLARAGRACGRHCPDGAGFMWPRGETSRTRRCRSGPLYRRIPYLRKIMPLSVKICGLSTPDTLDAALEAGADMVGFVFFPPSPRHLELATAQELGMRV